MNWFHRQLPHDIMVKTKPNKSAICGNLLTKTCIWTTLFILVHKLPNFLKTQCIKFFGNEKGGKVQNLCTVMGCLFDCQCTFMKIGQADAG